MNSGKRSEENLSEGSDEKWCSKLKLKTLILRHLQVFFCRVIITADDEATLRSAADDSTATPSVVIGRVEGGVEKWLDENETPDQREGAVLQFWAGLDKKKVSIASLKKFEAELSYRIRQDILVKPFTAVFDALSDAEGKLDMMERIGHCGDGYEWVEKRFRQKRCCCAAYGPRFHH